MSVLALTRSKLLEVRDSIPSASANKYKPMVLQTYYFRMWFSLIVAGALHGLILLPVVLSLAGGPGFPMQEADEEWMATAIRSGYEYTSVIDCPSSAPPEKLFLFSNALTIAYSSFFFAGLSSRTIPRSTATRWLLQYQGGTIAAILRDSIQCIFWTTCCLLCRYHGTSLKTRNFNTSLLRYRVSFVAPSKSRGAKPRAVFKLSNLKF